MAVNTELKQALKGYHVDYNTRIGDNDINSESTIKLYVEYKGVRYYSESLKRLKLLRKLKGEVYILDQLLRKPTKRKEKSLLKN